MWNAINVAHGCRAGLAGLAFVILSAPFATAQLFTGYGPRTTIGANYQQSSTMPSADGIDPSSCTPGSVCYVLFQQTPQQKPLIVQHVSCRVSVGTGALLEGFLTTRKGETFVGRRTYLGPVLTSGPTWAVNSPVMHLIKSGERPVVFFRNNADAQWGAECNISGQLQQP